MIHSIAKGMMEKQSQWYIGHPGFAWAFRRDSFECFYDKFIVGGGDVVMCEAFYGSFQYENMYNNQVSKNMKKDLKKYIIRIYSKIRGKVGFTKGLILHLWHWDSSKRQYVERKNILKEVNFDPNNDLQLNEDGCWEVDKELSIKIGEYFNQREED